MENISVAGEFGRKPALSFDGTPSDELVVEVLHAGDGQEVEAGDTITCHYYGAVFGSDVDFDNSFDRGGALSFQIGVGMVIPGWDEGLVGKHVGDRVLLGVTGADGYDSSGGASSAGIEVGDTLFFVVDIVSTTLTAPSGDTVPVDDPNLPSVTWDNGVNNPSVSIPSGVDAPGDLTVRPLIKGNGAQIADAGATVTVNYLEVAYSDGHVIDSTYGDGNPTPQTGALNSLIDGWQQGLVGQTVGSRVLLVVPGSLAYPNGNASPAIDPNATLVFVVDILYQQTSS